MRKFFQYHSHLEKFHLFNLPHILTLGIITFLCILIFVFKNALKDAGKRKFFCYSLALVLFVSKAGQQVWLVTEHAWSVKRDLPLELSDLVIILAIIMLWTGSHILFQFMYYAGLGSSIQAILTPDLGKFSYPHFRYIEFFVSHGGVVLACLFMVVAFSYRPTIRSLWMTFLIVNVYGGCIFIIDKWLGANYLYIMKKPPSASLLNYLGPWPWYIFSLELVVLISFYILYSPFWIRRKFD